MSSRERKTKTSSHDSGRFKRGGGGKGMGSEFRGEWKMEKEEEGVVWTRRWWRRPGEIMVMATCFATLYAPITHTCLVVCKKLLI